MVFKKWLKRTDPDSENATAQMRGSAPHSSINPSIRVSVADLVALRRYARQLDLERLVRSRASSVGAESSRFRGRGMDYQESRVYQAGDDIRNMDWRVTARAGRPHVKVYEEERERSVFFLVDFRPGMFFASRGALKSVVAAKVAAMLAWTAADRGDRIGALIVGERDTELRPRRGKQGVLMLLKQLVLHSEPTAGLARAAEPHRLTESLGRLVRIVRPGALVFVVSDFYGYDDNLSKMLGRLGQHADVVVVRPLDRLERQPPPSNRYPVTDGNRRQVLRIGGIRDARTWQQYFYNHDEAVRSMLERRRIPILEIATDDDIVKRLGATKGNGKGALTRSVLAELPA